jgi:hypothetical protein
LRTGLVPDTLGFLIKIVDDYLGTMQAPRASYPWQLQVFMAVAELSVEVLQGKVYEA